MREQIRVLLVTHSAVLPTGMAEVTRLIFNSLLEQYPGTYDIHQVGLMHCQAVTKVSWPIYPTKTVATAAGGKHFVESDLHGEQTVQELLSTLYPDIVFAYNDPEHVLHLCSEAASRSHKLILYVNFDGFPVPGKYLGLANSDRLIVSAEFGKRAFLQRHPSCSPTKVEVLYHPADVDRFVPVTECEKAELRRELFPSWMPSHAFVLG